MSTDDYADLGLMDIEPVEYTGGNFESMLAVATDPITPPVEGLDVPYSDDTYAGADGAEDIVLEDDVVDLDGSDDEFGTTTVGHEDDDIDLTDPNSDSDGFMDADAGFGDSEFDDLCDFGGSGVADGSEF